ncbi:hypothetical protein GE061_001718 [Apolygus lucorum]|uniref:Insulin-like domain-containing protein n=1 Tax=Apolygus lucorum TaxID=248454 RepID=A0A6A4KKD5_APOLU|nr:hypothetical protein GE061_001718 [Apolygus lucorum]
MLAQSIYVFLSLSALMCSALTSYPIDVLGKRNSQKYCGRDINEALKMLCHGVYNPLFTTNKRSGGDLDSQDFGEYLVLPNAADMDAFVAAIQSLRYPFASKATSLTMLPRTNGNYAREKRGIYDECCKKSCSMNELATYCGTD